jgi:hypothetical protein
MSFQETSDIEGIRAQISGTFHYQHPPVCPTNPRIANLEFLLGTTTFRILTSYEAGIYRAIILGADPETAGLLNYAEDNYSSVTKALQALLDRTSYMVSEKLREGGIEDKNSGNPVSKDSSVFPEVRSRKGDFFPQAPNFGLCQGSSRVSTGGVFGDRASRGLFADYEATQGPPPGHGQASAAIPTGGLFGATSSGGVYGDTSAGTGLFGNDCGASGRPNTNSCASNPHGAQGRQHPGLNTTVTVNLNGLTVSGVRGDGQGLFASFQDGSDSTPNNNSHFNISHLNRRDEPDDGLSGHFAQRPVRPQNDGPTNAAAWIKQDLSQVGYSQVLHMKLTVMQTSRPEVVCSDPLHSIPRLMSLGAAMHSRL